MKEIKVELPDVVDVDIVLVKDSVIGNNKIEVSSVEDLSINDFVLLDERGNEFCEIVKITEINGLILTLSKNIEMPHVKNSTISKLNYNKVKIERSSDDADYVEIDNFELDYASPTQQIFYLDSIDEASDKKYYKVIIYNSHTSTEMTPIEIHNEDDFGYVKAFDIRNELGVNETLLNDSFLYAAIRQGVEYIRDRAYVLKVTDISNKDNLHYINTDNMELADFSGDRLLNPEDLIVYEYDHVRNCKIYIPHLITKILPNKPARLIFKEEVPRANRSLIIETQVTFQPYSKVRYLLRDINKLCVMNYILRNSTNDKLKEAISSWSAGGTNVNRDGNATQTAIEMNDKAIKDLLDGMVIKLYSAVTQTRTQYSETTNYSAYRRRGLYRGRIRRSILGG